MAASHSNYQRTWAGLLGVRADEHLNLGIISPAHGLRVMALPRVATVAHH